MRPFLAAALLILATFVAYWPALQGEFIWDDLTLVSSDALRDSRGGLGTIWTNPAAVPSEEHFWPVVYTLFWIQARLWGGFESAFGFRLVNVMLHIANCLLIWGLLSRIGLKPLGSWVAAMLFALHPVHVESVAWIIELKDLLSGFFYLLAALAFFWFRVDESSRKTWWYGLALLFFALGMLSKSIVVTLPVALLIVIWWQQGYLGRRDFASVLPLLVLGFALALLDMGIAHAADTANFQLSWLQRFQSSGKAFWFYLGKLLFPYQLMAIYPRWDLRPDRPLMYLPLASALLFGVFCWYAGKRLGRSLPASLAFYVVTLGPLLGLILFSYMDHSFVADRYQYLASLGPLALAGGTWAMVDNRFRRSGPSIAWRTALGAILLVLGVLTWRQAETWRSTRTLFENNIALNSQTWLAHQLLGHSYAGAGESERAIQSFERSLQLRPNDNMNRRNIASLLLRAGRAPEAVPYLREALAIDPNDARAAALLKAALQGQADQAPAE